MFYVHVGSNNLVSALERERKKENPPGFRWESNPGPSDYQSDTLAIGPMAEERKKGLNQPTPAVLSLSQPNKLVNYFLLLVHVHLYILFIILYTGFGC